jgi:hypothetical protein
VSKEDMDKKDLDKRVRALTTLTKDDEIPALIADFFDSDHPLPAVCALLFTDFLFIHPLVFCYCFPDSFAAYSLRRATNLLFPILLFQREDLFRLILFLLLPKPPRLTKAGTEMMLKFR